MSKFAKVELPSIETALDMAVDRETWAAEAWDRDMYGTARECELVALLLRYYIEKERE